MKIYRYQCIIAMFLSFYISGMDSTELSLIEKVLIQHEVDTRGLETVQKDLQEKKILTIKTKLYKTEQSNPLAYLIFRAIENQELSQENNYPQEQRYGIFNALPEMPVCYAWRKPKNGPIVTIKADLSTTPALTAYVLTLSSENQ